MVRDRIQMRSHFEKVRDASRVRQYTERWFKFSSDPPDEIRYASQHGALCERWKTKAAGILISCVPHTSETPCETGGGLGLGLAVSLGGVKHHRGGRIGSGRVEVACP